jgi:hypothetical protein
MLFRMKVGGWVFFWLGFGGWGLGVENGGSTLQLKGANDSGGDGNEIHPPQVQKDSYQRETLAYKLK